MNALFNLFRPRQLTRKSIINLGWEYDRTDNDIDYFYYVEFETDLFRNILMLSIKYEENTVRIMEKFAFNNRILFNKKIRTVRGLKKVMSKIIKK
jgi:hypothetical protein